MTVILSNDEVASVLTQVSTFWPMHPTPLRRRLFLTGFTLRKDRPYTLSTISVSPSGKMSPGIIFRLRIAMSRAALTDWRSRRILRPRAVEG
jgi:hypothetical protein